MLGGEGKTPESYVLAVVVDGLAVHRVSVEIDRDLPGMKFDANHDKVQDSRMTMSTVAHPSPPRYVQKTSHSTPWAHVDSVPMLAINREEAVGAMVGSALGDEEDGSEDGFSEGSDEGLDEGGAVVGCAVGSPFLGVGRNVGARRRRRAGDGPVEAAVAVLGGRAVVEGVVRDQSLSLIHI